MTTSDIHMYRSGLGRWPNCLRGPVQSGLGQFSDYQFFKCPTHGMTWDGDSGDGAKKKRQERVLTSTCPLEDRQEHPGSRPFKQKP